MLSFVQLDKPHIDIELYGTDTNIAPIDKVHIMDEYYGYFYTTCPD